MRRNLFALAAMLAMLATGLETHAVCTAANPNTNVIESTPTGAFTDNGNGTVTHNLTGLMWKQCAEGLSGASCATGSATTFTWANALIQAKNANFAGQTDWRLPNLKELESIVESCGYSPSINQTRFPATPASTFWSGSSYVPNPANAWIVGFYDGNTYAVVKTNSNYARLVRGGQSFDAFDAQGDTTPDAFSFTAQTGVALSTVATSNAITVSGINTASPISIVGGTYSINGGAYTAAAGTVNNGDTVTVRQTSSASYSTLTTATLTIGGVSGAFNVTTLAAPPPPPPPPPPPSPQVDLAVNGAAGDEVTVGKSVAVTYQIVGCWTQEMYLILNAPAMGIVWSYLNAAGLWVALPTPLSLITPWMSSGPADGGYSLFTGNVPVGDYELYFGCDFVTNGHLDYLGGTTINGVYDRMIVHVR